MKSNLFYIIILFFVGTIGCSPKTAKTAITEKPVSLVPTEKSLLWKISGNQLAKPSYLYGTIHMIGKDDFFLTDSTKAVFDRSENVVFEINMEDMSDMSAMMSMIGKIMMTDGTTLKDLMSEADYKMVNAHFSKMGLPMMMLERVKPLFLSAMGSGDFDLSNPPAPGTLGGDVKSYEMEFMEMAKSSEKGMDGLETIEYQLSVFDSIPYKDQADMLIASLQSGDNGEDDELTKMVTVYKQQDINEMQKMFKADDEGIGKFEDIFLKNRNQNWIPVIDRMAQLKPTFFAVGAGHLGGENGVIALLRKKGFTVTPIFSKVP